MARWSSAPPHRSRPRILQALLDGLHDLFLLAVFGPGVVENERRWRKIERGET